ncbi:MAG: hypothetical protein WC980_00835 [Candidatus Brocadiia bacterium]
MKKNLLNMPGWLFIAILVFMLGPSCTMAETPPVPEMPAPGYVINNMETNASLDGDLVRSKTSINFSVLSDGWYSFRLFPLQASLSDFKVKKGKEKNILLNRKKDGYYILAGAKGDYTVDVEYVSRIKREKLGYATNIYFITAANNSLAKLVIPVKDATVSVQPEINFGVAKKGNSTEVLLYNTTAEEVVISWSSGDAAKITPTYFADNRSIYTVSRGNLRIESIIDYDILQGDVDRVEIALSPELSVISVRGDNIRKWDIKNDKDSKTLVIERSSSIPKSFTIELVTEKTLEQIPISFSAPKIQPLGVEREKGYIAINAQENVRVEALNTENISQVDIQEVAMERKPARPFDLIFKYLKTPFTLMLRADNIPPKVWADVVSIASLGKDSIKMDVGILYSIYDAGVSRFRIKLEPGLKVTNITKGQNINNWQVKDNILTIDLKSKTPGTTSYYHLSFLAEKDVKSTDNVALPIISLLDVEREQGYIGIGSIAGIKSEVVSFEGINQIDVKEFNPAIIIATTNAEKTASQAEMKMLDRLPPLDFAFRYFRHPFKVTFNLSDIKAEVNAEVRSIMKLDERKVAMSYQIIYTIRKTGLFNLKMTLPKELHIAELKGDFIDDWKRNGDELNVILSARVEGTYFLNIDTEILLEKLEKDYVVPVLRLMDVKKESGYLVVKSDPALRIKSDPKSISKLTEIDLKDIPPEMMSQSGLTLAYKYYEQPWTLTLNIERLKPTVMAETFQFVSVGEAILHSSTTIKYQILYAANPQFKILLPKEAVNVDITGANIKHKGEEKTDDGIAWTISLHSPVKDTYNLYVSFQTEMKKDKDGKFEPVKYSGIKIQEVERETGYLAIVARPDMELTTPEPENLTPIDEREIPAEYLRGIEAPILMSFRYLKHPYKLTTKINQNKFSEVLVAVIDAAKISTSISENGQMITDIVCQIRNTREQYLRMSLPKDAYIWHVRVAGQTVSCFTSDEKGVPITLIPIAQQSKTDQAFEINLRFASKISALSATGKINMVCPQMNIPLMRVGWTVSLPERYQIVRDGGNMEPVEVFESGIAALDIERRPPEQNIPVQTANMRTGQQVDLQWSMNSAAQENIRGGQQKISASGGGMPSVYGGKKPITTNNYQFQSLLPLDVPVRISSHYLSSPFHNVVKGILALLAIAGTLLFWFKSKSDVIRKTAVLIGLILVLVGFHTLSTNSYESIFSTIIWSTAAVIAVIMAVIASKDTLQPLLARVRQQSKPHQHFNKPEHKEDKKPEDPDINSEPPAMA